MKVCVAPVRPLELKVRVFEPMMPFLPSAVAAVDQSATPLTTLTVTVPVRLPVLIATSIEAVEVVTTLPPISATDTTGCVVKLVRFSKPAAWVAKSN